MSESGAERRATARGALLVDPQRLGGAEVAGESLFEAQYWAARGELVAAHRGRGSAWFVALGPHRWVLRHYRRGGLFANFVRDRYLWLGESRVRSFAEFRLLDALYRRGLAVPRPVAARYVRSGWTYRCDLVMERIGAASPLSVLLAERCLTEADWRRIGATLAELHRALVDHPDLTAHNILIDRTGEVSVIDFDRCRQRAPGAWMRHNLARLHRSLRKVSRRLPPDRFTPRAWSWLLAGYGGR